MKKLIFLFFMAFIIAFPTQSYGANAWRDGSTTFFAGTTLINNLDTEIQDHAIEPLNRYLQNARQGMTLTYSSASQLTVSSGSIVCVNSVGTLEEIRINPSSTTVTWANIDEGAEGSAKTYHVYASCDADATTAAFKISLSATAPTGVTLYKRLGSFYNNSSSNITLISNTNDLHSVGTLTSKSVGTTYQASTDGFVEGYVSGGAVNTTMAAYCDASSSPSTIVQYGTFTFVSGGPSAYIPVSFIVSAGEYYKVTGGTGGQLYFRQR